MRFFILNECRENDWAFCEWKKNSIDADIIFRPVPKFLRAVRFFWNKLNLPLYWIWYSTSWRNKISKYNVIVLHVSALTPSLASYLNKLNPNAKVIAWYWNCVKISIPPSKLKGNFEVWSFDPDDCKNYGMKFNHQYYFKSFIDSSKMEILWDVYFCGGDAGRGEILCDLYNILSEQGLVCKYRIVNPECSRILENQKSSFIPYNQMISEVKSSRCLIEIVRDGQSGATMRLMEALFNKKKVITTNTSVKSEPFFNPQNIFIVGERPNSELFDFVKSDYVNSNESFIEQYDVHKWLEHFVE